MKDLIIVGAGGFGRELLQWIKDINRIERKWNIAGFIDDNVEALKNYKCDYEIIGKLQDWYPDDNQVFACAIANPQIKESIVNKLKSRGAKFEKIIHPNAYIGDFSTIGEGFVMYPGAKVTVNVKIGDFVTLLSSSVGHDVTIGDFTTISSLCGINGNVNIGRRVFIGSNAVIIPSRSIGDDAYIGAGSVVITNIKQSVKVLGNPAKKIDS